jgi:hypothetical protein
MLFFCVVRVTMSVALRVFWSRGLQDIGRKGSCRAGVDARPCRQQLRHLQVQLQRADAAAPLPHVRLRRVQEVLDDAQGVAQHQPKGGGARV